MVSSTIGYCTFFWGQSGKVKSKVFCSLRAQAIRNGLCSANDEVLRGTHYSEGVLVILNVLSAEALPSYKLWQLQLATTGAALRGQSGLNTSDTKKARFDMFPTKAPGLDGLPVLFYQKFWQNVGDHSTSACLGFLNDGHRLDEVNNILITLIPKVKRASRMTEFYLISLCNVFYKNIVKALTNWFRNILSDVILESQSAFILGRLISDNGIVGFECMHALKRKKKGYKRVLALKLDMSKTYDRVE
ncbi:hypothetical protein Ddye_018686 [Dipteronia dyeriana]|uniref:Reverse transcriptase n=1 Tax=Dipteronia dyeriana TaxID=168575 RepID=A0AAD9X221_9ROSI|nr:hypothetical protein Ddye_018686 [Dipteronia dyeriana]